MTLRWNQCIGVANGSHVAKTYTFDDVVASLNGVAPYEWASFLHARVDTLDPPLEDGLDVRWNGPAFKAGISTGATVVAVNGQAFTTDVLKDAIAAARGGTAPIQLLLKYQDSFGTVPVDYHDGLRYPHLVRIEGTPDYLSEIIAARK